MTDAADLHFVDTGETERPGVVLMHAVGLDLTWWGDILAGLHEAGHRVVAVDLPGHGMSPALPPGFSLDDLAGRVADLLDTLPGGPFHLVGHSVGGMLAQIMAADRPDLVRTIAPVCSRATLPDEGREAMRARAEKVRRGGMAATVDETLDRWFTLPFRAARPDVIDRCVKTLLAGDAAVNAGMWDAIAGLDMVARLAGVTCPCQVIAGRDDKAGPPEHGEAIAKAVAGPARFQIVDSGHLAPVEQPDLIVGILAPFFDGAEQPQAGIRAG